MSLDEYLSLFCPRCSEQIGSCNCKEQLYLPCKQCSMTGVHELSGESCQACNGAGKIPSVIGVEILELVRIFGKSQE